jgi:hypothetical protein
MIDPIDRKRVDELVEYLDDLMEHTNAQLVHDMVARIEELEWLVAYVVWGLNDWSDGRISNSVFFTEAAAKRVRALAEKEDE